MKTLPTDATQIGDAMKIEVYQDAVNEFRARAVAANGKVIMVTSEGYKNRADCIRAVRIVLGLNDLFRLTYNDEGVEINRIGIDDEEEDIK